MTQQKTPVGPRLEALLRAVLRARKPILLEGATGVGKSQIVATVAASLGWEVRVLDLSLLEPPDLVGLPMIEAGVTRYARPAMLPTEGEGILLLEELNRAERFVQQPALQLLSARSLHDYRLPPGWVCVAAVNPEGEGYDVTALDPALRSRFLVLSVTADRSAWLQWAKAAALHPAVVNVVRRHSDAFAVASPRAYTYAAEVLATLTPAEVEDEALVVTLLSGYLPQAMAVAVALALGSEADGLDVSDFLGRDATAGHAQLRAWLKQGRSDAVMEFARRLEALFAGPEFGALWASDAIVESSLRRLLGILPGDVREELQCVLGRNPAALPLLPEAVEAWLPKLAEGGAALRALESWLKEPTQHHQVHLLITGLVLWLQGDALATVRRSHVLRRGLGAVLGTVGMDYAMPLVDTLRATGITPIRPT